MDEIPTFLELARRFADLNIESEDYRGTETEDYYTIQSAYNTLDSIVSDYNSLVEGFGRDEKIYVVSGETTCYSIYLIQDKIEYSWNKDNKAKELYNKITSYKNAYDTVLSGYTFERPFLVKDGSYKISTSDLIQVTLGENGEVKTYGTNLFIDNGSTVTYNSAKENDVIFKQTVTSLLGKTTKGDKFYLLAFPSKEWIKSVKEKLNAIRDLKQKTQSSFGKALE
mgnify:CR=1 FL=1